MLGFAHVSLKTEFWDCGTLSPQLTSTGSLTFTLWARNAGHPPRHPAGPGWRCPRWSAGDQTKMHFSVLYEVF